MWSLNISTGLFDTSLASPICQELKTLADEMRNPAKKQLLLLFLSLYTKISKQYKKEFIWFVFEEVTFRQGIMAPINGGMTYVLIHHPSTIFSCFFLCTESCRI